MKLRITIAPETERARVALRHGLSLTDDEIDRLAARLPLEVSLAALSDEKITQLLHRLEKAGVQSVATEARVSFAACSKHHRLATDQSCPRCNERTCSACRFLDDGVCPSCAAKLRRRRLWRNLRIVVLLAILAVVGLSSYADRSSVRNWATPLHVVVYPMPFDEDPATAQHLARVDATTYAPVGNFFEREARRYEVTTSPLVEFSIGETGVDLPPIAPEAPSMLDAIVYSLRLRWHAFNLDSAGDVRLFVLYHRPEPNKSLPHSVGIQEGHIGVVHVFAGEKHEPANLVVVAHELLHTTGATDKYDAGGRPIFPDGYADPKRPVQSKAELMAGAIPEGDTARPAEDLTECVVGRKTAEEIGWVDAAPEGQP